MGASTLAVGAGAFLAVPLLIVALVVRHAPFPQEEAVLPGSARAAAGIGPGVDLHRRLTGPRSMDIASYARHVLACVRQHEAWAAPVVCALAFGESLACIALVLPAWVALVGIGALIGARGIHGWPRGGACLVTRCSAFSSAYP